MSHGKNSKVWFETTPGGGTKPPTVTPVGYTALTKASSFRNTLSKDLAESDSFGSTDHTNESGLKGGALSLDVHYLPAQFAVLMAAYASDTPVSVIVRPEGDVEGTNQFYADYHVESIEASGATNSVVGGTCSLRRNGAVTYAAIGADA
jgi:hypothetical protein